MGTRLVDYVQSIEFTVVYMPYEVSRLFPQRLQCTMHSNTLYSMITLQYSSLDVL